MITQNRELVVSSLHNCNSMRQKAIRNTLLLASAGVSASAAFAFLTRKGRDDETKTLPCCRNPSSETNQGLLATSASSSLQRSAFRSYATTCDLYFQKYGKIPLPKTIHSDLPTLSEKETITVTSNIAGEPSGILVIGDVHGCYEEMLLLHEKAMAENGNRPFSFVILVGDLCNKGPDSVKVIRHVRTHHPTWVAIRGNHDDIALAAALGDEARRQKPTFRWIFRENGNEGLSDEDLLWLAELPYTIRIPSSLYGDSNGEEDTMIVHAGLIPNMPLEEQTITTMVSLRDVCEKLDSPGEYFDHGAKGTELEAGQYGGPEPWAHAWTGPFHIVFGHDAKRGLQQYPWATGLDTGCCYGKQLTALIIPGRKLVSVDALKVHSPITYKE
jgi:bis(5'-nucleosyl)-tetraphosphatase (symmetrical)